MIDKMMYNPNDDKQNYPLYRLKLSVEKFGTNQSISSCT